MSDETKRAEPTARPVRSNAAPAGDPVAPRTSTITFEPDNRDSVEAAIRILKQARADIDAAERARAEQSK